MIFKYIYVYAYNCIYHTYKYINWAISVICGKKPLNNDNNTLDIRLFVIYALIHIHNHTHSDISLLSVGVGQLVNNFLHICEFVFT